MRVSQTTNVFAFAAWERRGQEIDKNESVESKKKGIGSVDREVHIALTASRVLRVRDLTSETVQKRRTPLTNPLRGQEYPAPPGTPPLHIVILGSNMMNIKPWWRGICDVVLTLVCFRMVDDVLLSRVVVWTTPNVLGPFPLVYSNIVHQHFRGKR